MKSKVYYAGKPCIQAVATTMARAVEQNSESLPPSYMPEGLPIAFIGSSDKGGKPTKEVMTFIGIMDPKRIQRVCLFATAPGGDASKVLSTMRLALASRGIKVLDQTYSCQGKSGFGGKMPDAGELKKAEEFIKGVLNSLKD